MAAFCLLALISALALDIKSVKANDDDELDGDAYYEEPDDYVRSESDNEDHWDQDHWDDFDWSDDNRPVGRETKKGEEGGGFGRFKLIRTWSKEKPVGEKDSVCRVCTTDVACKECCANHKFNLYSFNKDSLVCECEWMANINCLL